MEEIEDNGGVLHLGTLTFIHTVSKQMDRGERPTSEATREVGHALRGVSERGWEKEGRRGEKRERERALCGVYSPRLVLKQQRRDRVRGEK